MKLNLAVLIISIISNTCFATLFQKQSHELSFELTGFLYLISKGIERIQNIRIPTEKNKKDLEFLQKEQSDVKLFIEKYNQNSSNCSKKIFDEMIESIRNRKTDKIYPIFEFYSEPAKN